MMKISPRPTIQARAMVITRKNVPKLLKSVGSTIAYTSVVDHTQICPGTVAKCMVDVTVLEILNKLVHSL